jgi:predicted nucleic acid-binding protein
MYLLDTNALSELLKKRPKPQFLTRLRRHPPEMFFTSSICVMELRNGSRRRGDHAVFWQRITHEVLSRVTILDFSYSEAVVAGDILAHLARRGELIGVEDVLIGATALVREYTVVTGMCTTSSVYQLSMSKTGWSSNAEPHPREARRQPPGFRKDGLE